MTASDRPSIHDVPLAPGAQLAPGLDVRAHMHRGRSLDVYEAWSSERLCICVAKTLRPGLLAGLPDGPEGPDGPASERLLREGRALERLTHPHIVRAYETIERPRPVVVLETLSGKTLQRMLRGSEGLSPPDVAALGRQLASALAYLHGHGLLHLDLKPSNVIADRGRAKLIDLSVARPPGSRAKGVGTRRYMSPEQLDGGVLTERSDSWGLGALLLEAATGRPAFSKQRGEAERANALERVGTLPALVGDAIAACLDPDTERRPAPAELFRMLE